MAAEDSEGGRPRPGASDEDGRAVFAGWHPQREPGRRGQESAQSGRQIDDFRLIAELGRGGVGTVWEAEQLSLGRRVALKLLAPQLSLAPEDVERFRREAAAGGRLSHPGIVAVHEIGECDGTHYIAQELVERSCSLADFLAGVQAEDELPEGYYRAVARLFAKVADALQVAHDAGVVHREIKPANILITEDDEPKVADLGLAKINDDLVLTRTGQLAGTPFYMRPEQALSQRSGLDHRTDVFCLGATLYEALTLRPDAEPERPSSAHEEWSG